ncbi:MAG: phosphoribosylanthranilate isomerase [Candidatus Kapaibacterium sp.]|nr:MAG: phosphoribosylanthranilate isomerase [Candidatus Kapabacteria bacterium]
MLFKVCGMRDEANIHALLRVFQQEISAKTNLSPKPIVPLMGFIFYAQSPRFVGNENTLKPEMMRLLREHVQTIGVFVNAEKEEIAVKADQYSLAGVQLHGTETPDFCRELRSILPQEMLVLKAFSIAEKHDFISVASYEGMIDYALFDTKGAQHGGNGTRFNWALLDEYTAAIPFLLSGGIDRVHAEEIKQIRHAQLAGLDINSRFEDAPALKNVEKIGQFLEIMLDAAL